MKYYLIKAFGSLENIIFPLLVFFAPIKGIFLTVAVFIALDTCTGIWKCKKLKKPITSRGLSALVSKTLLYEALVLATFLIDTKKGWGLDQIKEKML